MEEILVTITSYAAPVFVVLSFVLKNIRQIRIVNLIGCVCFVIYGILKGNGDVEKMLWPIIIPNAVLCAIQIYYLFIAKEKK